MTAVFSLFYGNFAFDRSELVHVAAARSARIVGPQLGADTTIMSAAELRGYIRARATLEVRNQVLQAVANECLEQHEVDDLIAGALERTVHLLVQQRLSPPVAAIPTPHVRLRIAA